MAEDKPLFVEVEVLKSTEQEPCIHGGLMYEVGDIFEVPRNEAENMIRGGWVKTTGASLTRKAAKAEKDHAKRGAAAGHAEGKPLPAVHAEKGAARFVAPLPKDGH